MGRKRVGGLLTAAETAALEQDAAALGRGADAGYYDTLEVGVIEPSPSNPRVVRVDARLRELMASIAAQGVVCPVLVRPVGPGRYELVAGERRWRACRELGVATIPAIVRELDAEAAFALTMAENYGREDLTAMEEARGVELYLDRGWTLEAIADQLGHGARWVAQRAQIGRLSASWRAAARGVTQFPDLTGWSSAMLALVARFSEEVQERLYEGLAKRKWDPLESYSLANLAEAAGELTREIKLAPFPIDREVAGCKAPMCSVCLERSSRQPELFDRESGVAQGDVCLNGGCWDFKVERWVAGQVATADKKAGGAVIRLAACYLSDREKERLTATLGAVAMEHQGYVKCKKGDAGARAAVVVAGAGLGKTIYVQAPLAKGKEAAGDAGTGEAMEDAAENREARMEEKLAQHHKVRRRVMVSGLADTVQALMMTPQPEEVHGIALDELVRAATQEMGARTVLTLVWAYGLPWSRPNMTYRAAQVVESGKQFWAARVTDDGACQEFVEQARPEALEMAAMRAGSYQDGDANGWIEALWLADLLGVDMARLARWAAEEKPYPKGLVQWTGCSADTWARDWKA
jgi:ParB family chromosome partitioning protein